MVSLGHKQQKGSMTGACGEEDAPKSAEGRTLCWTAEEVLQGPYVWEVQNQT